jgi:hypothetical protein
MIAVTFLIAIVTGKLENSGKRLKSGDDQKMVHDWLWVIQTGIIQVCHTEKPVCWIYGGMEYVPTYVDIYIYIEGQKLNQNAHTFNFMSEVAEHNP